MTDVAFGHDLRVLAGRNLRVTLGVRNLVGTLVNPLVFFFAFTVVLRGILTANGVDFAQFLAPGIVVQTAGFAALSSAYAFADDRRSGMLRRLRSLPISGGAVFGARLTADAVQVVGYTGVILVAGYLTGFRVERGPLGVAGFVAVSVAFGLALAVTSAVAGLASRSPETVGPVLFLAFLPLLNFSSALVPIDAFPSWLQPLVRVSPFTAAAEALRAVADDGRPLTALWPLCGWVLVLAVGCGVAARRVWRRVL